MEEVLEVFFDGNVFKPMGKVKLFPNRYYTLYAKPCAHNSENALDILDELTGTIEGPFPC